MRFLRSVLLAGLFLGVASLVPVSGAAADDGPSGGGKGGGRDGDKTPPTTNVPEIGAAGAPAALVLTLGLAALVVDRRRRRRLAR